MIREAVGATAFSRSKNAMEFAPAETILRKDAAA